MNRTLNQKKVRTSRKRTRSTRDQAAGSKGSTAKSTQALRILAQIAMLKRALQAADDEDLPHKAICDYLHTLSQMAKLEASAEPVVGDTEVNEEPAESGTARQPANIRERLRQAVADIYGIADLPPADPATTLLPEGSSAETNN